MPKRIQYGNNCNLKAICRNSIQLLFAISLCSYFKRQSILKRFRIGISILFIAKCRSDWIQDKAIMSASGNTWAKLVNVIISERRTGR